MNSAAQLAKAQLFRHLHDRASVLLLPYAGDASARFFASAGFSAVATTSAGVTW